MKPRPSLDAERFTRDRVIGGHYRAGKLDTAYAAYLVLGACIGVMAVAVAFSAMTGPSSIASYILMLAAPLSMPAVVVAAWSTLKNASSWPLPALGLAGLATPLAAIALDAAGNEKLIPWMVFALSALYILAPIGWFAIGRKRCVAAWSTTRELSPYSLKVVSCLLIILGGAGCLIWPFVWRTHYSEHGMGGWTGGPTTLIFLGYAPFVALIAVGLGRWPERRRKLER